MDAVFKALADETRRGILDALFDNDGQSVQGLCGRFPAMTRFGVMKHLAVLHEANLVTFRKVGRVSLQYLNPVPVQQIADRWIGKFAQPHARALIELQAALEPESA